MAVDQADRARLHLRAEDAEDLPLVSALVQDLALLAGGIRYDRRARTLTLVGSRFRWEAPEPPTRIVAALRLAFVDGVQRRHWPRDPETALALLAITADGTDHLQLAFGGGAALRLAVEVVDLTLEDVTDPWPALSRPDHAG